MVAVNTKLLALARALRTDGAQRIIVLDATKEGAKILLQTGETARRPAQAALLPTPARPLPQAVARAIETQAGMRPAGPAFGEAARAYDSVRGDPAALADPMVDDAGRATTATRADAPMRDGVTFPPVRGESQNANANPPAPGQGLVAAGVQSARRTIDHEDAGSARSWSLKWWNPSVSDQSNAPKENSFLGKRFVIAAAVIIAGLAIASLL